MTLRNFVMMPTAALSDRRLKARHLKVLGAICKAIDAETSIARLGQQRISELAGVPRAKLSAVIAELGSFGYVEIIDRGRRERGHFLVKEYRISYPEPCNPMGSTVSDAPCYPRGSKDRATPSGETHATPGVAVSYLSDSNLPQIQTVPPAAGRSVDEGFRKGFGRVSPDSVTPETRLPVDEGGEEQAEIRASSPATNLPSRTDASARQTNGVHRETESQSAIDLQVATRRQNLESLTTTITDKLRDGETTDGFLETAGSRWKDRVLELVDQPESLETAIDQELKQQREMRRRYRIRDALLDRLTKHLGRTVDITTVMTAYNQAFGTGGHGDLSYHGVMVQHMEQAEAGELDDQTIAPVLEALAPLRPQQRRSEP